METQSARNGQPAYSLAAASILLGIISMAPLVITILGMLAGNIFGVDLQWLRDTMGWLGSTNWVVYIGWLSLPGLLLGIIALIRGMTGAEKGLAVIGIILGALGMLWTYFISSMLRVWGNW